MDLNPGTGRSLVWITTYNGSLLSLGLYPQWQAKEPQGCRYKAILHSLCIGAMSVT